VARSYTGYNQSRGTYQVDFCRIVLNARNSGTRRTASVRASDIWTKFLGGARVAKGRLGMRAIFVFRVEMSIRWGIKLWLERPAEV
jgi:hypothetical protein